MTDTYRLDRASEAADCRFVGQLEDEAEAGELTENHTPDGHGQGYTDGERHADALQIP